MPRVKAAKKSGLAYLMPVFTKETEYALIQSIVNTGRNVMTKEEPFFPQPWGKKMLLLLELKGPPKPTKPKKDRELHEFSN